MRVIGIVGPIASGKGIVAKELKAHGYCVYSLSDRIREELKTRGLEETRINLRRTANDLRKKFGPDVLAKRTIEKIESDGCDRIVVEAIRNTNEAAYLKQHLGARIIGVDAPREFRYKYMQARNRPGDPVSYEGFSKADEMEWSRQEEHKMNIAASLEMAEYVINNIGTLEELKQKVNSLLEDIS